MSSGSDTPSHPAPPPPSASNKITPRDVASATAVGAATRLGMARRKAGTAEGAAVGVTGARGHRDRGQLVTAIGVVAVMVGMLALMIVLGK